MAGTRRYAASQKLGLSTIPAIVEDLDDKAAYELALTENLQRKTLSPFEEAKAFLDYVNKYRWGSITDLARKISKSHSYIVNRLKLVELPASISKEIVTGEQFSVGHAEELLRLDSNEKMEEVADAIKEHGLTRDSTAEVVDLVKEHKMPVDRAVETVRFTEKLKDRAQQISEQAKRTLIEAEPEKAKRIADIADEGFKSLEKRLELFPERSQKMEPKFEQLGMWEERGIIPYTIWDFTYRDDYAGDKDFHGNCSPQVVGRQALGSRVVPFTFTAQSKSELGFKLMAAVNSGRLKMYTADGSAEYPEFWQEIEKVRSQFRPNQTMNFLVDPSQGHDDFIMSLALLVEAAHHYSPRSARGN